MQTAMIEMSTVGSLRAFYNRILNKADLRKAWIKLY